jgi:hypothetical protein
VELARSILGCEVASFPFKYLGLPQGLRKVTAARFSPWWTVRLAGCNRGVRTFSLVGEDDPCSDDVVCDPDDD